LVTGKDKTMKRNKKSLVEQYAQQEANVKKYAIIVAVIAAIAYFSNLIPAI